MIRPKCRVLYFPLELQKLSKEKEIIFAKIGQHQFSDLGLVSKHSASHDGASRDHHRDCHAIPLAASAGSEDGVKTTLNVVWPHRWLVESFNRSVSFLLGT